MKRRLFHLTTAGVLLAASCPPPDQGGDPVKRGERLFFEETFGGNGRTCGTCHPRENNFTLDPEFIATLPKDDPLFVAEFNPDLAKNFENPRLMRELGLILENLDGFADLEDQFVMRGIPHTLALRTSVASGAGPRTGWSGDGAPGDGSLRAFATGAVIQHFTKTTNRVAGVDFRLPTEEELDALEAFQLSLGRQQELSLPIQLKGEVAARGQEIFLDRTLGKCSLCHFNAGANGDPAVFGPQGGNLNFDTGVEELPDQPADLTGERVPPDDGFGIPGNGTFNTPPLVEAADSPPFFHNNAVATIEGAVAFYDGEAFNNSPAGQVLAGSTGGGIELDATQIEAVAAFLRVLNALENIRESLSLLEKKLGSRATHEMDDALRVLAERQLHLDAVAVLRQARARAEKKPQEAIELLRKARSLLAGGTEQ